MKSELFTKENFRDWLKSQPAERTFRNCNGATCVGHAFVFENNISPILYHMVLELDELSGGWFRDFFDARESGESAGELYNNMCKWMGETES